MELIASWIWDPLLSFIYIELGLLFLISTGLVAWRRSWNSVHQAWKKQEKFSPSANLPPIQAFVTALGASVGVGNLAGVSTAIHLGGPGALFWMWVSALVGMSFRMCSTYFAMHYQPDDTSSPTYASPMSYLQVHFSKGLKWIPISLAALIMVKGFLTANLIQSNSVAHALEGEFSGSHIVVAFLMATAVALVILGGLKRIVAYSTRITPWMLLLYIGAGLFILLSDIPTTLSHLGDVFYYAFQPYSVAGGVIGFSVMQSLQYGISRGVFSHGSGLGIAPFLHASNDSPAAHNGLVAAFVPIVDTLLICTITALVVLSSGLWSEANGAYLTTQAFEITYGEAGRVLIIICLVVFAFTTMISWAHYAERCFHYLGGKNLKAFRWLFIAVTFLGPFLPVKFVWSLGDILIAIVLLLHMLPLTYITLRHYRQLRSDFESVDSNTLGGTGLKESGRR